VVDELIHLFHAGRQSVMWPTLSFSCSHLTALTHYPTVESMVDIGTWYCARCGWWRGVAVTRCGESTKLLYTGPG